jgi:PAS domain S-box-containing protein
MRRGRKESKSAPAPKKRATARPRPSKDERRTKAQLIEELHQLRKVTGSTGRRDTGGPAKEEELSSVLMNAPLVLFRIDADGIFTLSEGKGLEALGLKPGEVVGQSAFELYRDIPEIPRKLKAALKGRELKYVVKVGDLWFETILSPMKDRKGTVSEVLGVAMDITERRMAQEQLELSGFAMDNAGDAIFLSARDGRLHYVNEAACAALGYSSAELLSQSVFDIDPDFPKERWPSHWSELREAEKLTFETRHRRKDGKIIPVEVTTRLFRWGGTEYNLGFARDISDRKKAEETLRESEQRLKTIAQATFEGIAITESGTVIDINAQMANMLGYEREELLGRNVMEFVAPESREQVKEMMREGFPDSYEHKALRKDATVITLEARGKQSVYKGRNVRITAVRDITERKNHENALVESEARFRELADLLPQPVCETDAKGELTYANVKGLETFGYTWDDLRRGMYFLEVFAPEERGRATGDFGKALRGEELDNREYLMMRRDGHTFPAILYTAPILRGNQPVGVRGILMDISDLRRLESQLLHAQKMEAIGTLTAGVAHEFNNILTSILGFGEFLQDALGEESAVKKYADMIVHSAERAAKLTTGMLAYTRKQITVFETVELNRMLESIEDFLSDLVGENITLQMRKAEGELPVRGDRSQLEQVILNLTTNAIDAMPEGGTLTIESGRREMAPSSSNHRASVRPGTHAFVSVTDTGAGMDAETREKIFEPFFTTKEVGKGTGLGLSVVYGIVERHEGTVQVASAPDRGTSFEVIIPIGRAAPAEERGESTSPAGGRETVLVAEDDESVRDLIRLTLESAGYRVIEAADGEEAVGRFARQQDQVDFLLFDVAMPKKDGLTAVREIRDLKSGIKGAFLTGNVAVPGVEEEGYACIFKPISPKDLLKTIRKVMDS